MKDRVFKLLPNLPIEMYESWRRGKKVSQNKTLAEYASFYKRGQWMMFLSSGCLMFGFVILPIFWGAGQLMGNSRFIGLVSIITGLMYVGQWIHVDDTLRALEEALTDPRLEITDRLEYGRATQQDMKEVARARLEHMAFEVLATEDKVGRSRRDSSVSESQLFEEIRGLLKQRVLFDETLSLAVEFGLSDDKPGPYFVAAGKQVPIPSEGRYKY